MTIDWASFTPWTALAGGVLIGLGASLFVMANGRIAGISGLLAALLQPGAEGRADKSLFLLGILCAPLAAALFGHWPAPELATGAPGLLLAGLLVGIGTRYASGCTSGHGVCGLSRLSPRALLATACFMGSGFATVYALRHLWGG